MLDEASNPGIKFRSIGETQGKPGRLRCMDPGFASFLTALRQAQIPGAVVTAPPGLVGSLELRASLLADEAAVVDRTRRYTYADLDHAAQSLSTRLSARGIGSGHRVGIEMGWDFPTVAAVFAILKCGAKCMPLHVEDPEAQRRELAADADVRLVMTQSDAHYECSALPLDLVGDLVRP